MDINFELYKVFYHIALNLSFSKASKSLYISQSAVSQSLALLEERLGCKLLFRNTKQVRLTPEGKILFEYVEQAFNFIKAGERNINELHTLVKGDIWIGASDTICKYYLLPYFKLFNQIYPDIKIHITNRTSPRCIELLRKGSVDFSIINIPEQHDFYDIDVLEVKPIQDVFAAGKGFSNLKNRRLKLKDLENYPVMVLEKNSTTRKYFDNLLKKNKVSIIPEIELSSADLLVELSKINLGIAYVMKDCIEKELREGELFMLDIEETIPERSLGILTHKNLPLSAASDRFIKLLLESLPGKANA
jgi:DNA-binding transcriptional LysR family regulator